MRRNTQSSQLHTLLRVGTGQHSVAMAHSCIIVPRAGFSASSELSGTGCVESKALCCGLFGCCHCWWRRGRGDGEVQQVLPSLGFFMYRSYPYSTARSRQQKPVTRFKAIRYFWSKSREAFDRTSYFSRDWNVPFLVIYMLQAWKLRSQGEKKGLP